MIAVAGGSDPSPGLASGGQRLSPAAAGVGMRAIDALPVFTRLRSARDTLPRAAADEIAEIDGAQSSVQPSLRVGAAEPQDSRLLLSDLGSRHVALYAVRTSKGQVCTVFSERYGSPGCFGKFATESPISWDVRDVDEVGAGDPAIVSGLVPPQVSSIDVVVGGATHRAELANNAFFYELSDSSLWPDALVVNYEGLPPVTIDTSRGEPVTRTD